MHYTAYDTRCIRCVHHDAGKQEPPADHHCTAKEGAERDCDRKADRNQPDHRFTRTAEAARLRVRHRRTTRQAPVLQAEQGDNTAIDEPYRCAHKESLFNNMIKDKMKK